MLPSAKRTPITDRFIEFYMPRGCSGTSFSSSHNTAVDLTKGVNKPHHHNRLPRGAKLDIMLWLRFLKDFNGRSFVFSDVWETSQGLQAYADAAGSIGFGAVFDHHWLHGTWQDHWKCYDIALLELFPIVISVHI